MHHNFFIHSSVNGHQGCFHVLALVSSAAMNPGVHVSFGIVVCSRYMPSSGTAGSYGIFIDDNHSLWGAISLSFWFVLPLLECWASFHIPISHLHVFSGFMLFKSSAHLLINFFVSQLYDFFGYIIWKYLLPFSRLPFHFVGSFLCCAKAF